MWGHPDDQFGTSPQCCRLRVLLASVGGRPVHRELFARVPGWQEEALTAVYAFRFPPWLPHLQHFGALSGIHRRLGEGTATSLAPYDVKSDY